MIEGYSCVDCMLLDFWVSPDLATIQVVVEVQDLTRHRPTERFFGHMKFRITDISELQLRTSPLFRRDLDLGYGYKGNEIYEFSFERREDGKVNVKLHADELSFTAVCPEGGYKYFLMSEGFLIEGKGS